MSVVRPSCRKKSRWPTPHSGAVRNSFPVAVPWETLSARSVPMLCTAKSEKRFAVAKFSPEVRDDAVVGSDLVWHASQWMLLNRELPCDGPGAARIRRGWGRWSEEAHEIHKLLDVADLGRARLAKIQVVFGGGVEHAVFDVVGALGREQLVGDAHLHVVGLPGEHLERPVLRLPAEPADAIGQARR